MDDTPLEPREPTPGGLQPPPLAPPPPAPPVPAGRGMPRGAKIALLVGAVALILVAVIVVLAVVLFINVVTGPADVANSYMEALDEGRLDEAFSLLSAATREEEGRDGFASKVGQFEGTIETFNTSSINVRNRAAEVRMDITLDGGESGTWYFYLVREDGEWRILKVSESRETGWDD